MGLVVWLNGPFGVGKTTVAEKLLSARPSLLLYDPEIVGTMLRKIVPPELQVPDYQDMGSWRRLVPATALELIAEYERPLVVPMTIVVPAYFDEMVGGLRRAGVRVEHFTLLAEEQTIRRRLSLRREAEEWAAAQLSRCLPALHDDMFAERIDTERRTAEDVAAIVLDRLAAVAGSE